MMQFRCVCLLFFSLSITTTLAQKSLYLLLGTDIGGDAKGYKFERNGEVLKRGWYGVVGAAQTLGLKVQCKPNPYVGIETGLLLSNMFFAVYDAPFLSKNGIDARGWGDKKIPASGHMGLNKLYLSGQLTAFGYLPLNPRKNRNLYLAAGVNFNEPLSPTDFVMNYRYDHLATSDVQRLTGAFSGFYCAGSVEAGFQFGHVVPTFIGYKFCFGGPLVSAEYNRYENNEIVSSDRITATTSYQALCIWTGLNLIYKSHTSSGADRVNHTYSREKQVTEIKGRTILVAHSVNIVSPDITIQVWDDEDVDGDKISLCLNDRWILNKYILEKEVYEFTTSLTPGNNFLTIHANSMGKRKPCTIAILIDDGFTTQKFILDSDFKQSSTIKIVVSE